MTSLIPTLSVIIVAQNEAHDIRRCLESIKWADEIIVFDSGSTDGTQAICREYTDKVFETDDWPGDGPQKNRALQQATSEWILSLDADEEIPKELAKEIKFAILSNVYAAYTMPRKSFFCEKYIRFGAWANEKILRLFKREKGKFTDVFTHTRVIVDGSIGTLTTPMIHHAYPKLEEVLIKMNDYSTAGAELRYAQGKKSSLTKALIRAFWAFFRSYFLFGGFLDGRAGFILAVSIAEGTYYRYLKLMYLHRHK